MESNNATTTIRDKQNKDKVARRNKSRNKTIDAFKIKRSSAMPESLAPTSYFHYQYINLNL